MANNKETRERIKINKLLEEADWRFFDDNNGSANIQLEPNVKHTEKYIDAFGHDFENTKSGFIDFSFLDDRGFPLVNLEAKKEEKDPLDGKERARRNAKSKNESFVILSNGNLLNALVRDGQAIELDGRYKLFAFQNLLRILW